MEHIIIKETTKSDLSAILIVEKSAFGQDDEAELTKNILLDKSAEPIVSLLAWKGENAIGHILFSKALIENYEEKVSAYNLAPLAIIPEFQNQGIGGMLINKGIEILRDWKIDLVFVLGHITYYPKYGFLNNAAQFGFNAPYPIPEEVKDAWMIQYINNYYDRSISGKVICCKALDKPEYWRE